MPRDAWIQDLVRGGFQIWSYTYDWWPLQILLYRPVHHAVLAAIDRLPEAPRRAMDLGCGTARLTRDLTRRHPRATVVGLDFSEGMLAAARRRPGATCPPLVRGNAYTLPFATGSLDLVTSSIAYHWLGDARTALREIRRVLMPDGHFVLGTLVARLFPRSYLGMRIVTPGQHRADLAAAGLEVVSVRNIGIATAVITARVAATQNLDQDRRLSTTISGRSA